MNTIISENIMSLINAKKMTLADFYSKCESPEGTLRKIIYNETNNPKIETLVDIANTLDVSIDYLIGRKKYDQYEKTLLRNYRNASNHGKQFIQEMAKYEAYYTDYENNQTRERNIICIEPTGDFQNGVLWDSCKISRVTTYLPQIYFAFKIPTHAFLPTYAQGEVLFIEHRLPKEGENAIFYKDNKVYVRNFLYSRETGFFTLKAISMDSQDIIVKSIKDFHIIGTIIIPDRTTIETKSKNIKEVPLPLDIQELINKIKEPK